MKKTMFLLTPVLCLISALSFAINCKNTRGFSEKAVCTNYRLRLLDTYLTDSFKMTKQVATNKQDAIDSQINWVKEKNQCATIDCVADAYKSRTALLNDDIVKVAQSCSPLNKNNTYWRSVSSAFSYYKMGFDQDGGFHSWSKRNLDINGTWSLDEKSCTVSIVEHDYSGLDPKYKPFIVKYKTIMPNAETLILIDKNNDPELYKKLKSKPKS